MPLPSVSVCFPAYNEEKTVEKVLHNAYRLLKANHLEFEMIVCDDASTDNTGAIIEEFKADKPEVHVIHHEINKGIRDTFEELNYLSNNEFIFLNSTDGQWKTEILLDILPMTTDWDVIIASRKHKPYGIPRLFISWFFNLLPRILFGVNTFDAGAVKLVRREIIQQIPLVSITPFSEAERLIKSSQKGYKITEFPVEVEYRKTGKSTAVKWSVLKNTIFDVCKVWMELKSHQKLSNKINMRG